MRTQSASRWFLVIPLWACLCSAAFGRGPRGLWLQGQHPPAVCFASAGLREAGPAGQGGPRPGRGGERV